MDFKMTCPKCKSPNIETTTVRLWSGVHDGGLTLHCIRCGKVMYGEKSILEERERQMAEWEAAHSNHVQENPQSHLIFAQQQAQTVQGLSKTLLDSATHQVRYTRGRNRAVAVKHNAECKAKTNHLEVTYSQVREMYALQETYNQRVQGTTDYNTVVRVLDLMRKKHAEIEDRVENNFRPMDAKIHALIDQAIVDSNIVEVEIPENYEGKCEWEQCRKLALPKRKYCSTECRCNKARHEFKLRKTQAA